VAAIPNRCAFAKQRWVEKAEEATNFMVAAGDADDSDKVFDMLCRHPGIAPLTDTSAV
jgi:hypothetical protein